TRKGANMWGGDQDDVLIAPWTTIKYRISGKNQASSSAGAAASASTGGINTSVNTLNNIYPNTTNTLYPTQSALQQANNPQLLKINWIETAAASSEEIPAAMQQITALLRDRHHLREDEPNDFQIRDMTEMMNTMKSTTDLIGRLLLIVAAISLVVGGVGIMNIM